MKRNIIYILLLCCLALNGHTQISFYKTYTGGLYDVGQGAVELPDSSYAVTGSTSSLSTSSSQTMLMVVDSLGNHQWTKGYGGDEDDWGRRIFYRENEGFWIFGYSNSYGDGSFDFAIWRIDEQGELLWEKNFPNPAWDRLWDAVELPNGDFIFSGETEGDETFDKDIILYRVTDEGDVVWKKQIENDGDDIPYALSLYDDTTLIVAGEFYQNDQKNGIILNLHTADGEENSQWIYDEDGPASFRAVDVFDGLIFPAGAVNATTLDYVNTVILKVNLDYDVISAEVGNTVEDDFASNIIVTDVDQVYWSLQTTSSFWNVFPHGWDTFVLKYHTDLYFLNISNPFTGYNSDIFGQIISTSDGGMLFVGECSDDRFNDSKGRNVMLVKSGPNDNFELDPTVELDLLAISNETLVLNLNVYPNPFKDYVRVEVPKSISNYEVFIYDNLGRIVDFSKNKEVFMLEKLKKGNYFLNFRSSEFTKTFKLQKL